MANEEGEEELSLEFTPTWVVAVVCFIIIAISLAVERCIHYGGKVSFFHLDPQKKDKNSNIYM